LPSLARLRRLLSILFLPPGLRGVFMPRFGGQPRPRTRPAVGATPRPSEAPGRVDRACRLAVAGKLALREIANWVEGVGVSETEFRLLWLLYQHALDEASKSTALDQADLAERLAVSAAQVSGVIERLRQCELVNRVPDGNDRRRQLWRLATAGETLVLRVVTHVASGIPPLAPPFEGEGFRQEDAA
jgi:DNA-binding MarR family transcriptional regulator